MKPQLLVMTANECEALPAALPGVAAPPAGVRRGGGGVGHRTQQRPAPRCAVFKVCHEVLRAAWASDHSSALPQGAPG